ncbi:Sodium/glucose cotransporter [subsurface metagenome]
MVIIGIRTSKAVKSTSDYFIGGRKFGKFISIMLMFGSGTHADQAVGVISKCYQVGLAGIWYQWIWLIVTPFYWLMGPVLRRLRVVTASDIFRRRYDQNIASLYSLVAIAMITLNIGLMLLGSGRIVEALTGGKISFAFTIWAMTLLFVTYGIAGGFIAAAITDVIQGVLTIILSFILLPFAIIKVGGFSGLHEKISLVHSDFFSLIAPGDITLFFITMAVINAILQWPCQPHHVPICSSGKTEMESRVGVTFGNMVKRFCTVAWAFTGIAAVIIAPGLEDSDHAFGAVAQALLPTGLVGLLLASVIAAVQSTCDAMMISAAGIFTRNVYKVYISDNKTDRHYLLVARISSLIVVAAGILIAFYLPGVVKGLELIWQIPALMAIPFWAGIFWRRANPASAWVSFLMATGTFLLCEYGFFAGIEVPLPFQMLAYLTAGLAGAVVTALLTSPQDQETLDVFYRDLQTPVDTIEEIATDTM